MKAGIGRKIVIRIMGKFVASLTYILIIVFAVIAALAQSKKLEYLIQFFPLLITSKLSFQIASSTEM